MAVGTHLFLTLKAHPDLSRHYTVRYVPNYKKLRKNLQETWYAKTSLLVPLKEKSFPFLQLISQDSKREATNAFLSIRGRSLAGLLV